MRLSARPTTILYATSATAMTALVSAVVGPFVSYVVAHRQIRA